MFCKEQSDITAEVGFLRGCVVDAYQQRCDFVEYVDYFAGGLALDILRGCGVVGGHDRVLSWTERDACKCNGLDCCVSFMLCMSVEVQLFAVFVVASVSAWPCPCAPLPPVWACSRGQSSDR